MATLANNLVLNTTGGGANWQWHFTITTREDANNYYVDIATYVIGAQYYTYQMDLVSNDIWWNLNFDGSSFELFRLYISNGRYQTLSGQTKYGNKTVTKTYAKTSSAQSKKVSFGVTGSATIATNLLGTASNGSVSFTIPAKAIEPEPEEPEVKEVVLPIKVGGVWKSGKAYYKTNGEWYEIKSMYLKQDRVWKEHKNN